VEREVTFEPAMKLGIRPHLAEFSLSNTVSVLDILGVKRCRSTVYNWVSKAELQPTDGIDSDHTAVNETVIQVNEEWPWLYAAIDSDANRLLHAKLSSTRG
jgi:transposase-like protein